MEDYSDTEKGQNGLFAHDLLSKEVYGVALQKSGSGEAIVVDENTGKVVTPSVSTSWGLKVRVWIRKMGAEEGGIERVPEELRTDQHPRDLFTLWMSANKTYDKAVGTATLAFGTLGPGLFYLGLVDSMLCLLFFNLIGALPPALAATLGPKLGLRTMTVQRYAFGWWPAKILAFVNLLNQIGWAMVNTIAGGAIFYDVGDGHLPLSIAVLVLGLAAIIVGLFGYDIVHKYERYSWMVMTIAFIIIAGFGAKHFVNVPMGSGQTEISSVLSFGTAIIGFQISWTTIAADYAVYMRETTKPWKVFMYTYLGQFLSQFLIEALGAALMTTVNGSDAFQAAYDARGIGGLTGQIFVGYGTGVRNFGKFVEAVLAFSVVAVVITNVYSLGLNVQMISDHLMKVPRLIWSLLGGAIFLIASIAGRSHLQAVMENFLNVVAYWLTPFLAIMLMEHLVFRRGFQYDVTAWDDQKKLPYGIAAFTVFIIGTVLAVLCMSQTWWVGPIALRVGDPPYGTDISWELALGVTVALYIPSRWLERRLTGF